MTTLADAKLTSLEALTGNTGHVNDLEAEFLVSLGATAGSTIVDQWWEVFDTAAVPAGQFNDRAVAYIVAQVGSPPSDDYNEHWRFYWENVSVGPVVPQPPLLADLFHWYDFTDPLVLWQDTAGTIPIVDGQDILRVDDKGTEGTVVLDDFPAGPTWRTNQLNGFAGTLSLAGFPANLQDASWGGASPPGPGVTIYSVGREGYVSGVSPSNHYLQAGGPGVMGVEADPVLGQWAGNLTGSPQPTGSGRAITLHEWVWNKAKGGASNEFETSGSAPVVVGGPFVAPIAGTVTLGQAKGSVMEVLVYGRELTGPEEALVIAYFDAKYGPLPQHAPPPVTAPLIHHYDFTDNFTVFRNPSGTQLARDGDTIRLLIDKGISGSDLTTPNGTDAPTYRTDYVNGENIADFSPGANSKPMTGVDLVGTTGSKGLTNAIIFRIEDALGPAVQMADWSFGVTRLRILRDFGAGFMTYEYPGPPGKFSEGVIVPGSWYLWYFSTTGVFAGADDRSRLSGELQIASAQLAPDSIPAVEPIILTHITSQNFQIAEWAVWEGPLSDPELALLEAYADAKYGTLPHGDTSIPATGNLLHHVDPTDPSTVWADAAGTIPAVNGGTVLRIDNKGTRGTPLASATGTPIYRTGTLNGENVIEFSGARLEALAESPGLAVSTTGCTIAMVTRRRASHFGDSILWRWTPFAGTPGPSLRGKFTLNGNFGRADPIADEVLVADPSVIDSWYLLYWSLEAGAAVDDAKFGSPGPEVAGPFGDITDIPDLADVRFGTSSTLVEHAEAWFWDRPLTLAERAQLVAYADGKYGTLPHT